MKWTMERVVMLIGVIIASTALLPGGPNPLGVVIFGAALVGLGIVWTIAGREP